MQEDTYLTLSTESTGFLREKASKFFAFAYPVRNLDDVEAKLKEVVKQFHDARHVCYAYRIGPKGELWRANDAGEPAHSAGDPILNELKSKGVSDALCVVVRYFGGTKLGVGGLIRAYGDAAKDALDQNPVAVVKVTRPVCIRFPYNMTAEINRTLHAHHWQPSDSRFQEDCQMRLDIPLSQLETAQKVFSELGVLEQEACA